MTSSISSDIPSGPKHPQVEHTLNKLVEAITSKIVEVISTEFNIIAEIIAIAISQVASILAEGQKKATCSIKNIATELKSEYKSVTKDFTDVICHIAKVIKRASDSMAEAVAQEAEGANSLLMAATMAGIHVDNTFAESGPEASNSASSVQPDLIEGIETANSTQPDPIEETENADPQPVVTEGVKDANTHATL